MDGVVVAAAAGRDPELNPGYFALVMATGIVSQAMRLDGAAALSGFLLGAGIVAYVVLLIGYAWRLAGYRREFLADATEPRRALASPSPPPRTCWPPGWQATVPPLRRPCYSPSAGRAGCCSATACRRFWPAGPAGRALAGANGTWLIWVVGIQSIAVATISLRKSLPEALAALATCCWAVGVVLYLVIAVMVATALMQYPVRPAELTPPYWVFMGATAVSVLAGALILRLPPAPLGAAVHGVVAGLSVVLWAFGTWLIPLCWSSGPGGTCCAGSRCPTSRECGASSSRSACTGWPAGSSAPS